MSEEKEFVNGLIVKAPHENAPDFVKCGISIKRKDLGNWLREKDDDWINIQVKVSGQSGKWYAEVDNWKPNKDKSASSNNKSNGATASNDFDDDIPFNKIHSGIY